MATKAICYFCGELKTCTPVYVDHEYPNETVAVCEDCLKEKNCVQCDDCGKWLANQTVQSEPFLVFGSQGHLGYETVGYIDHEGNRTYDKQITHWINEPERGVCGQCYDDNYSQCPICKRHWYNKDLVDFVVDGKPIKICPHCADIVIDDRDD